MGIYRIISRKKMLFLNLWFIMKRQNPKKVNLTNDLVFDKVSQ